MCAVLGCGHSSLTQFPLISTHPAVIVNCFQSRVVCSFGLRSLLPHSNHTHLHSPCCHCESPPEQKCEQFWAAVQTLQSAAPAGSSSRSVCTSTHRNQKMSEWRAQDALFVQAYTGISKCLFIKPLCLYKHTQGSANACSLSRSVCTSTHRHQQMPAR